MVLTDTRPTAMPPPAAAPTPAPVLVAVGPPLRQSRPKVAARFVLALPPLVVLALLAPVAVVAAFVGWGGALASGRLPTVAADFLSGYLRYQTRVFGYLFLLTDHYPPFTRADADYPVRVTTSPGVLNRWSVAFRLVLAVPALVVLAAVAYPMATVVLVVTWLVVLVGGRTPASLHGIYAAFLRYQARVTGYLTLVTSEYPWGLLGDADVPVPSPAPGGLQPRPPSPVDDPYWRVVLAPRAKNLIVFVIVLGVTSVSVVNIAHAVSRYHEITTDEQASVDVQNAYTSLSHAVVGYETETKACADSADGLTCLTHAAQTVSDAFAVFDRHLATTTMPAGATAARDVVVTDGTHAGRAFALLSASSSAGRYELVIETSDLPLLLTRFDQDYLALGSTLTDLG